MTDDFGQTAIGTGTVTVVNVPPTAASTGDTIGVPGLARSFLLAATDPSLADTLAGFTFHVDFGDGATTVVPPGRLSREGGTPSGPPSASHTYLAQAPTS